MRVPRQGCLERDWMTIRDSILTPKPMEMKRPSPKGQSPGKPCQALPPPLGRERGPLLTRVSEPSAIETGLPGALTCALWFQILQTLDWCPPCALLSPGPWGMQPSAWEGGHLLCSHPTPLLITCTSYFMSPTEHSPAPQAAPLPLKVLLGRCTSVPYYVGSAL